VKGEGVAHRGGKGALEGLGSATLDEDGAGMTGDGLGDGLKAGGKFPTAGDSEGIGITAEA
jgi:hypothetical protein